VTAASASAVALVTGGANGIGRATALAFARNGTCVMLADLDAAAGESVADEVRALGAAAAFVRTDVADEPACARLVSETLQRFGRLDIAFNNAGITGAAELTADYGVDDWQRMIGVNLSGVFYCMRHELKAMADRGGAIVNTASIMGLQGTVGGSAYCAAKHGVIGLTRAAALEYGKRGVRINAICPGIVETAMTVGERSILSAEQVRAGAAQTPLRRIGTPEEVAALVVWLCSAQASFVSGAVYTVDGGLSAG
jgi:NAD(P)-dependent dehydrogenase (short-subunit alcohol dehydrogenase family)